MAFIFTLSPLTSALVNRVGCRLTTIIGGLSCVIGLLLTSFASSIYIIYVTYSVLFGFGASCLYVSCYVITSQYFNKNHSIYSHWYYIIWKWTSHSFCSTNPSNLARLLWLETDVSHNCWNLFSCSCFVFDIWSLCNQAKRRKKCWWQEQWRTGNVQWAGCENNKRQEKMVWLFRIQEEGVDCVGT